MTFELIDLNEMQPSRYDIYKLQQCFSYCGNKGLNISNVNINHFTQIQHRDIKYQLQGSNPAGAPLLQCSGRADNIQVQILIPTSENLNHIFCIYASS